MHFTAWSLEWKPDTQPPICKASGQWSAPKLYAYKWATFGVRLKCDRTPCNQKRRNWGTLEKLTNRWVRCQCLWFTAEIKCSALFKYKVFWIKLCLIIWILYLRKLSWMFCSPIGSKTRQTAYLTQKKSGVQNCCRYYMYTFPLPIYLHKCLSSYNSSYFLREEQKRGGTLGT